MSDELLQELHSVVKSAPDDDEPRLVIADWFESQGVVDRADFIRLQLEQASVDRWDPKVVLIELKARAFADASGERWRRTLPHPPGVQWGRFERGFVRNIAFNDVGLIADCGDECAAACPFYGMFLRWPRLGQRPELPAFEGLRELTMIGPLLHPDDARWLADSPLLSTIDTLNLVETQIGPEAFSLLLASPYFGRLRRLRMPWHDLGNDGIDRLVDCTVPALVELDLSVATLDELGSGGREPETTMDDQAAVRLSAWPTLAQLESLNLSGNHIREEGTRAILSSPRIANLKTLRIRSLADYDEYDDGGHPLMSQFAHACEELSLDELDIGESLVDEATATILGASPALAELKILSIDYGQKNSAALFGAPWMDSIRILSACDADDSLFTSLIRRHPERLHTLELASTYAWSQMRHLPNNLHEESPFPSLLVLDLSNSGLYNSEVQRLCTTNSFPNLVELRLAADDPDEGISEEAACVLAESPFGHQLTSLETGYPAWDRLPRPTAIEIGSGDYHGPLNRL